MKNKKTNAIFPPKKETERLSRFTLDVPEAPRELRAR